jgi:O-antigen biosynthesis protein
MRATAPSALPIPLVAPTTEAPDVSVIVVNYNVREFLEQALSSVVRASAGLAVETFVVDNNSVDGSVEMVRAQFPGVQLIANEENVGFARANNQAIRRATGRYLLILNPDTLLQEDTLQALVAFMDARPDAGAAGCRILNPDGTFAPESRRAFPTPTVALYRMTGLSRLFPTSRTFGRYNLGYLPADQECEVDALSGSCMMVRRDAILRSRATARDADAEARGDGAPTPPPFEITDGAGLLDEDFFMYGEDLDWCYRIQQAGWRIHYTPSTQIIHYKGECTRKGELRYVRLFYGAMLRFAEKHFAGRHSRVVASLIRAGILGRAGLSATAKLLSALAVPLADFVLALAIVLTAGAVWSAQVGIEFPVAFYLGVAPACALATMLVVATMGGYRRRGHRSAYPLRPVLSGVVGAFLLVSSALFFLPALAFSRAVLVLGFFGTGIALMCWRIAVNRRRYGQRRALLVGATGDAERLHTLLGRRIDPPLRLIGFVSDEGEADGTAVLRLGATRHLRDLVRLRQVDDVVFAAESLTNTAILGMMRTLRDLPVQFKILTEGRDRIIGKASVDDLATPLREAEELVAPIRSPLARRSLEVVLALLGIAALPVLRMALRLRPASTRLRLLVATTMRLPSVLAGRRALIGFDVTGPHPPQAWGLRPGLVSILDTLSERPADVVQAHRAYWFYARNQSASLDVEILVRALFRQA